MKTVITAIANPIINNELKKEKNIEVIGNDIQYKDGVIEILEKNIEVNYIILSDILIGEELLINLIRKINEINKNIKISRLNHSKINAFKHNDTDYAK